MKTPIKAPERGITHIDAHYRFIIALFSAILTLLLLRRVDVFATRLVAAWDVFAFVTVGIAWVMILWQDPYEVRRTARLQDGSRTFLFVVVVSAATMSLVAVFVLLGSSKNLPPSLFALHTGLSVSAIVLSWILIHTLFTLRYAHYYYFDARKVAREKIEGGLIFPEDDSPDYLDFAYFSLIIGMTCQVSDVQITSKDLRHLATVHGVISFMFNTAILAMVINILAGLI